MSKVKDAKRNLKEELEEEKPEESDGGGATSDEEQNVPKHMAKTVRLKARKASVIKKAKIQQNIQSKIMYASNHRTEGVD